MIIGSANFNKDTQFTFIFNDLSKITPQIVSYLTHKILSSSLGIVNYF